tara:strand:- start:399 stop:653 length:255 start_codon:yes stop_codon:yes gene_type:complete
VTQRRENVQRLQIGVLGLVAVILLVGLAGIANDRASNEVPVTEEIAETGSPVAEAAPKTEAPKEPLAELGAVPAPEETSVAKAK